MNNKNDMYKSLIEEYSKHSPSEKFALGGVFDISRLIREYYIDSCETNDVAGVHKHFINSYKLFLDNPEMIGISKALVNKDKSDTDPYMWNADIAHLSDGSHVALLYMPVQGGNITARLVGIIFGEKTDGYYYCMLNKEGSSEVYRNKAFAGIEKIGEVSGSGLELMKAFQECISKEYLG